MMKIMRGPVTLKIARTARLFPEDIDYMVNQIKQHKNYVIQDVGVDRTDKANPFPYLIIRNQLMNQMGCKDHGAESHLDSDLIGKQHPDFTEPQGLIEKVVWIMCDPEGNGSGFLDIKELPKENQG